MIKAIAIIVGVLGVVSWMHGLLMANAEYFYGGLIALFSAIFVSCAYDVIVPLIRGNKDERDG